MKYRLNKLTPKTTNHFKINDFEVELQLPKVTEIKEYKIENNGNVKIKTAVKENKLKTKIGLEFPKYLDITITIEKNSLIKEPIQLTYHFSNNDCLPSQIHFIYEESSSADFIIQYHSKDNNIHWNYLKEIITMNNNSTGSITYWNNVNENSINMMAFEGILGENSKITHNIIDNGGNIRVYNAFLEDKGYQANNQWNMIYIGKDHQRIDMNYDFKNIGKKSINQLVVEGVLSDQSEKKFRGTIDFKKGSVDSIGEENENCILLSDTCKSSSLPMLLCEEESVTGSHGESSGKVSKDKLFYLMSRGFSKKEAERFIVMSNFNQIIKNIPDDSLQEQIMETISNTI